LVLAGGKGTRLGDLTLSISKQLLGVYAQPMIFYPIKTLIDMGIRDILIIVADYVQLSLFEKCLGNGSKYGVKLEYIVQESPNGLAEAFIIGEDFIGTSDVTLILGDNVFLMNNIGKTSPNTIFTYKVKDPSAYGVATFDKYGKLYDIVEKPQIFIGEDAVVGLYVFKNNVIELAKTLKPSPRGELEIVDLIKEVMVEGFVNVEELTGAWFDCGNFDDLLDCANFVRTLAKRTNHDIMLNEI